MTNNGPILVLTAPIRSVILLNLDTCQGQWIWQHHSTFVGRSAKKWAHSFDRALDCGKSWELDTGWQGCARAFALIGFELDVYVSFIRNLSLWIMRSFISWHTDSFIPFSLLIETKPLMPKHFKKAGFLNVILTPRMPSQTNINRYKTKAYVSISAFVPRYCFAVWIFLQYVPLLFLNTVQGQTH